jgi:hypothetical protein
MAHNECETRTLAALRDALLPRLISGELRVNSSLYCTYWRTILIFPYRIWLSACRNRS